MSENPSFISPPGLLHIQTFTLHQSYGVEIHQRVVFLLLITSAEMLCWHFFRPESKSFPLRADESRLNEKQRISFIRSFICSVNRAADLGGLRSSLSQQAVMVYLVCLFSEQLCFPLQQWNVNALFADSKTAEEKITAYYMEIKMCEFAQSYSWDQEFVLDQWSSSWQINVNSKSNFLAVVDSRPYPTIWDCLVSRRCGPLAFSIEQQDSWSTGKYLTSVGCRATSNN